MWMNDKLLISINRNYCLEVISLKSGNIKRNQILTRYNLIDYFKDTTIVITGANGNMVFITDYDNTYKFDFMCSEWLDVIQGEWWGNSLNIKRECDKIYYNGILIGTGLNGTIQQVIELPLMDEIGIIYMSTKTHAVHLTVFSTKPQDNYTEKIFCTFSQFGLGTIFANGKDWILFDEFKIINSWGQIHSKETRLYKLDRLQTDTSTPEKIKNYINNLPVGVLRPVNKNSTSYYRTIYDNEANAKFCEPYLLKTNSRKLKILSLMHVDDAHNKKTVLKTFKVLTDHCKIKLGNASGGYLAEYNNYGEHDKFTYKTLYEVRTTFLNCLLW